MTELKVLSLCYADTGKEYPDLLGPDCNFLDFLDEMTIDELNTHLTDGTLSDEFIRDLTEYFIVSHECGETARFLFTFHDPKITTLADAFRSIPNMNTIKDKYRPGPDEDIFDHYDITTYRWGKYYITKFSIDA